MEAIPDDLRRLLSQYQQEHLLSGWSRLGSHQQRDFEHRLRHHVDFPQLASLYAKHHVSHDLPALDRIAPFPAEPDTPDPEAQRLGEEALSRGEVAILVVAGGQGSRFGALRPKGTYDIGPVSSHSLFRIHAEKVRALQRRYHRPIPFLVMTSPATDAKTREYFEEHENFGLSPADVVFFMQGVMPALEMATGRLLMEAPGQLCLSPNGHGGTLGALAGEGLLDRLGRHAVRHIFYFQVDNPLVFVGDATFLGRHIRAGAEVSSKAIPKTGPRESVGNFVAIDGRCHMMEYIDFVKLPTGLIEAREPNGDLRYNWGSPAIHWFRLDFLERMVDRYDDLPFHIARKKVSHWDPERGERIEPDEANALKFERFIFDLLPHAERSLVVATSRTQEFAPIKNDCGYDSPETARQAMSERAIDWMRRSGAAVVDGAGPFEIGPLYALDYAEFADRFNPCSVFSGAIYFGDYPASARGKCSTH